MPTGQGSGKVTASSSSKLIPIHDGGNPVIVDLTFFDLSSGKLIRLRESCVPPVIETLMA